MEGECGDVGWRGSVGVGETEGAEPAVQSRFLLILKFQV